ncbi:hypothetical protein ACUJ63_004301 [Salmonella enterica subsp. enterica]
MFFQSKFSLSWKQYLAGAIKTLPLILLAGPLPLHAADSGTVQVNQNGTVYFPSGISGTKIAANLNLCMLDAAYPSVNCGKYSTPPSAGVYIWTDKSNCWSLSMDVSGTVLYENKTYDVVKRPEEKWGFKGFFEGDSGTSKKWSINATGHYRWTARCPGNPALPSGSVRFVLAVGGSTAGIKTWDYPLYDPDIPGPVVPPTPEVSCTASKKRLDLAHGTIAVNKVSTTAPEAVTLTCSNKTRPAITVNGVALRANGQTIVPVADNDKATSTLDANVASYTQADNGVTVVTVSSTVKLKQAGRYDQAVPLVFSIP